MDVQLTEEQEKAWDSYKEKNPNMRVVAEYIESTKNIALTSALKELFVYGWNHGE